MFTGEGGEVAVLAGTETDVNLIGKGDWNVRWDVAARCSRDFGNNAGSSNSDSSALGRTVASGGNSSSDDGGDAKQLHDGQRV